MPDYTYQLDFYTNQNDVYRINVPNADPEVGTEAIKSAMTVICEKGAAEIIASRSGCPISIKAASLITRDTTDYDLD